jgi:hypothetical protein
MATTKPARFDIGDRVQRLEDVYDQASPLLRGAVTDVYSRYYEVGGFYPELYEVQWDGRDGTDYGFLPHGLEPEAIAEPVK